MARPNPTQNITGRSAESDDLSNRIAGPPALMHPGAHPELNVDTPLEKIGRWLGKVMRPKDNPVPPAAPAPDYHDMSHATEDSLSAKYLPVAKKNIPGPSRGGYR
jgi:hypothetical protein